MESFSIVASSSLKKGKCQIFRKYSGELWTPEPENFFHNFHLQLCQKSQKESIRNLGKTFEISVPKFESLQKHSKMKEMNTKEKKHEIRKVSNVPIK